MFGNLIESGSHTKDFKRKSSFFLGTLAFYALLLSAAGVGSIYAFNARLDEPDFDVVMMMRFPPVQAVSAPEPREAQRPPARAAGAPQFTSRPVPSVITPYDSDRIAPANVKEVRAGERVRIAPTTSDAINTGGPIGPTMNGVGSYGNSPNGGLPVVRRTDDDDEVPPVPRPAPAPQKPKPPMSLGVINSKAIAKPTPEYSSIAKAARAQGTVAVQILLDETGKVISAQATNGHPLLRKAAVEAAYRARFTPTLLSNQPVKVSGFITYNFVLQ